MRDRVASLSLSQFKWRLERDHAWRRLPITQIRAFDTLSMKVMPRTPRRIYCFDRFIWVSLEIDDPYKVLQHAVNPPTPKRFTSRRFTR